ncbi:hypothetical protein ONZ45_g9477 [Pleurotus djamor]|nr:hypothetical protein ONZ45_g9477 [Pleurotus djamor]
MPFDFSDAGSAVLLQVTIQNYVEVISLAILFYDYLLTFDLEVERFWRRPKLSLVPILFFVNRYGVLLGYVPTVVMLLRPDFLLPGNVLWTIMDKSNKLHAQESLCINVYNHSQGNQLAGNWAGLFLLDFTVFSLTLRKTLILLRDFPDSFTLWSALIRDGAVYFGVLFITNFANILMLLLGPPALKALLTDIINILASTLISRLMLNLRDKSVTKLHGDTLTTRAIDAPIQFAPRMPNRNANTTGFSAFSWKSDISSTILNA